MHIHILGIGGTFMSALAILAKEAGFEVSGCDENCYPPVSDLLTKQGILFTNGYQETKLALTADCVIVGNVIKRGMPVLEAVLNQGKAYRSGPQWLAQTILARFRVIAVAGTHGKTTTTSMLAFILDKAGLNPGFLIGGVAPNFNTSARLGKGAWFVIEADEYDSAFFDKRPKFMHYQPEIALLNNLEFDHADIYDSLAAIQQQFHYYVRTLPAKGTIIKPRDDIALNNVLKRGVFTPVEDFSLTGNATWRAEILEESGRHFRVWQKNKPVCEVNWPLIGQFNVENGLAALAASSHAGVELELAAAALAEFKPAKRRLEVKSERGGITIYDDFAHHPTAISKTILALKQSRRHQRIVAVVEFASYTMRMGVHASAIGQALAAADSTYFLKPDQFDLELLLKDCNGDYHILEDTEAIVEHLAPTLKRGDAVLVMSNRHFDNIHQRLIDRLDIFY